MGRKKFTMIEKTCAITLMEQGVPINRVAADLKVIGVTLFKLKKTEKIRNVNISFAPTVYRSK